METPADIEENFYMPDIDIDHHLREKISAELSDASASRMKGNEGRARVCARRAAGWAVASIYEREGGESIPDTNAYRFLRWFEEQEKFPDELREAAGRLTTKVGEDFTLPFEQDILSDAELIVTWILTKA